MKTLPQQLLLHQSDKPINRLPGKLWIVATPIGNLEDLSPHAVDVLRHVSLILAEDTKHSKRLLEHFDVFTPMQSWHLFNERQQLSTVLTRLRSGQELALISDAGTPLISDPGGLLVQACQQEGIPVSSVPGACAAICALSISGIAAEHFYFEGFLPAKSGSRQKRLTTLAAFTQHAPDCAIICYEAPHRLLVSLTDMQDCFGPQRVVATLKELTKMHERVLLAPLAQQLTFWRAHQSQIKGEWVIIIAPYNQPADTSANSKTPSSVDKDNNLQPPLLNVAQEHLLHQLLACLPTKHAVQLVAELTGQSAKILYKQYCCKN